MAENIEGCRQKLFLILMCVLSAAGGVYYSARVGRGFFLLTGYNPGSVLCAVVLVLLAVQLYSNETKRTSFSAGYRILIRLSGICVALLVFGGCFMVPMDIILFLFHLITGRPVSYGICAVVSLAAGAVLTLYGAVHARKIRTVHYTVPCKKIGNPCRVVQLSDLHLGSVVGAGQMRRAVRAVNRLKPDIVVITGDLVNHGQMGEISDQTGIADILAGIRARDGVFAVTGNHDPQPNDPVFDLFLKNAGIRLLNNVWVSLPGMQIYGRSGNSLKCRETPVFLPEAGKVRIVLDHYPDGAGEAADAQADLFLAGHTHAGQYFPCTFLVRRAYPGARRHGMFRIGDTACIVSAGTGFFQIPVRVGTDSEVACIDLVPQTLQY